MDEKRRRWLWNWNGKERLATKLLPHHKPLDGTDQNSDRKQLPYD